MTGFQTGQPRPVIDLEVRLRRESLDLAESLGMSPRSRAKLGLDLVRTAGTLEDHLRERYDQGQGS